ncbi:MAG: TetR/AcrR family transcriptional regulator [Thermoplasmata archaeon]
MSRTRSEAKRKAILAAAIRVFAKEGLSAPTSAVSREAGVAEGTLFIYFPTKIQLLDAVYRNIRIELATAILSSFPRKKDVRTRMLHIWDRFVGWGVEHPDALRVAVQMGARSDLTPNHSATEMGVRAEFEAIHRSFRELKYTPKLPPELVQAALDALAEMTIQMILRKPGLAAKYRRTGFELFWNGVGPR